jgi:hypothetical protein
MARSSQVSLPRGSCAWTEAGQSAVGTGVRGLALTEHLTDRHVQRGEQVRRAVPHVVMDSLLGDVERDRQHRLDPVQGLDLGFSSIDSTTAPPGSSRYRPTTSASDLRGGRHLSRRRRGHHRVIHDPGLIDLRDLHGAAEQEYVPPEVCTTTLHRRAPTAQSRWCKVDG